MSARKLDPPLLVLAEPHVEVRFATELPWVDRMRIADNMRAISRSRPRERVQPLEANGERALRTDDEPAKRAHVVRYYYTSMSGELLAAEFGGFTSAEADQLAYRARLAGVPCETWPVKRPRDKRCDGLAEGDPLATSYPQNVGRCAATTWCTCRGSGYVERPAPALRPGVRLVTFPSEIPRSRAVEVVTDDEPERQGSIAV